MRYMKSNELSIKEFAEKVSMSHDMVTRLWKKGTIKGRKKNPFARNSPVLIPSSELERVKKVIHESQKR